MTGDEMHDGAERGTYSLLIGWLSVQLGINPTSAGTWEAFHCKNCPVEYVASVCTSHTLTQFVQASH